MVNGGHQPRAAPGGSVPLRRSLRRLPGRPRPFGPPHRGLRGNTARGPALPRLARRRRPARRRPAPGRRREPLTPRRVRTGGSRRRPLRARRAPACLPDLQSGGPARLQGGVGRAARPPEPVPAGGCGSRRPPGRHSAGGGGGRMTAVASPRGTAGGARPTPAADHPNSGQSNGNGSGPVDTYEQLRQEVLAEVQRRSIDTTDGAAVEALAKSVVEGYQAKARSGFGGLPLANAADVTARLCRSVRAWGPLTPHFTDEVVFEELFFHGADVSWLDGEGRLVSLNESISPAEVRSIIDRLLATGGAAVDESRPMVQVQVLDGRARLGVVIPPIADALDATLR